MTDPDPAAPLEQFERAASEVIPRLIERLGKFGLGEIEVREGSLRVRVAKALAPEATVAGRPLPERVGIVATPATGAASPAAPSNQGITSPAVGFFVFADGLGPGLGVDKGDELGHVEMLGVRHDVRAPRRGTVRNLVTETGEAVEYGQLLIELEPGE
jgi:acetyl-CoA carboxylase biotin carboxyl carrier protein